MDKLDKTGAGAVIGGLLVAATPLVFPVCQGLLKLENGNTVPMRCFWTARAELLLGALVLLTGLVTVFTRSAEGRQRLNHILALLGLAVVLTPLLLIPTCANPDMLCNLGAKPAWLILGSIVFVMGLWGSRAPKSEMAVAAG
jgi:hypothetical protein